MLKDGVDPDAPHGWKWAHVSRWQEGRCTVRARRRQGVWRPARRLMAPHARPHLVASHSPPSPQSRLCWQGKVTDRFAGSAILRLQGDQQMIVEQQGIHNQLPANLMVFPDSCRLHHPDEHFPVHRFYLIHYTW